MRGQGGIVAALVWLGAQLRRAELMVFLPAVTLAAFWLGGEQSLILVALIAPMVFALAGAFRFHDQPGYQVDGLGGLALRPRSAHSQIVPMRQPAVASPVVARWSFDCCSTTKH